MAVATLKLAEKKQIFGDFTPYLNKEGMPSIFWEEEILTEIHLPAPLPLAWNKRVAVTDIRCHKKIAKFLEAALDEIHSYPEVWATINDYGGCYNFRLQRRSSTSLSSHCWGIAIDLDVSDNPFGAVPKVDPRVEQIFKQNGFAWGGNFNPNRRDGMHFEFVDISKL